MKESILSQELNLEASLKAFLNSKFLEEVSSFAIAHFLQPIDSKRKNQETCLVHARDFSLLKQSCQWKLLLFS